jgi:type II secretory pathway pseudopilin PulG
LDKKRGFTLIELILVIGLLMVIIVAATSLNSQWFLQNNLDSSKSMSLSFFRKAQGYAMAKKNNLTWGVCLNGNTLRLFGGTCASPTIKDDYIFPVSVGVSNFSQVIFSSYRGEPDTVESVVLSGNNKTFTININLAGGISVN